jgi:hypothetical protein
LCPQLFPIAVKPNPLTRFGRIGRADEGYLRTNRNRKDTPISWYMTAGAGANGDDKRQATRKQLFFPPQLFYEKFLACKCFL